MTPDRLSLASSCALLARTSGDAALHQEATLALKSAHQLPTDPTSAKYCASTQDKPPGLKHALIVSSAQNIYPGACDQAGSEAFHIRRTANLKAAQKANNKQK
jgi:hypothetical protein